MGFFSEIKKVFKKVDKERRRALSDINEEAKRSRKKTLSFFGLGPPPTTPPLPPIAPPQTLVKGQASGEIQRRQRGRVSGRSKTIVTGELSPQTGKKSLLGR